ncbi:DUF3896 family protein [Robertmurraya sp. FSL R5-0851]|uniref:DUF3896 family protein n=1 Tax=Robertmurraya sp. FSL R5-0851 TaxID=2921584 RepID=UPI004046BE5B
MELLNYFEIKRHLAIKIENLLKRLDDPNLPISDGEALRNMIDNYQYISEIAEMNHFQRGIKN